MRRFLILILICAGTYSMAQVNNELHYKRYSIYAETSMGFAIKQEPMYSYVHASTALNGQTATIIYNQQYGSFASGPKYSLLASINAHNKLSAEFGVTYFKFSETQSYNQSVFGNYVNGKVQYDFDNFLLNLGVQYKLVSGDYKLRITNGIVVFKPTIEFTDNYLYTGFGSFENTYLFESDVTAGFYTSVLGSVNIGTNLEIGLKAKYQHLSVSPNSVELVKANFNGNNMLGTLTVQEKKTVYTYSAVNNVINQNGVLQATNKNEPNYAAKFNMPFSSLDAGLVLIFSF